MATVVFSTFTGTVYVSHMTDLHDIVYSFIVNQRSSFIPFLAWEAHEIAETAFL